MREFVKSLSPDGLSRLWDDAERMKDGVKVEQLSALVIGRLAQVAIASAIMDDIDNDDVQEEPPHA